MEKRISYSQFQSVKCVAKACEPLIAKRNTLRAKIEKLAAEYKDVDSQVNSLEAGIVNVFGVHVEELVKKVTEPGVDANGKPKKTTKYLPTSIVSYDEQHKQYVISLPDEEQPKSEEAPAEAAPSDETNNIEENVNEAADECAAPVGEVDEEPTQWCKATDEAEKEEEPTTEAMPTDAPIFD